MEIRLFIIAITPVLVILLALYLSDRRDREPFKLLVLTYFLGALTVIPILLIEEFLLRVNVFFTEGALYSLYTSFIVAGMVEEYFKRLVILKVPYKTKYFNERLDGIVYSVFASMGFATIENIVYVVFRYANNPHVGFYRGVFSVPAHAVFAITMGYYLSLAKFNTDEADRKINMRRSFYMPMLLHGTFNFILSSGIPQLTALFVPYVLYLWFINQRKLSKFIADSKHNVIKYRRDE